MKKEERNKEWTEQTQNVKIENIKSHTISLNINNLNLLDKRLRTLNLFKKTRSMN